jgi:hypothetical protein
MKKTKKSKIIEYYLCYNVGITTLDQMLKIIDLSNSTFNKIKRIDKILYNTKYEQ